MYRKDHVDFGGFRVQKTSTAVLFLMLYCTEYRFQPSVGDRFLHMLSVFAHHIITHSPQISACSCLHQYILTLSSVTPPHASSISPGRALFTQSICVCCIVSVSLLAMSWVWFSECPVRKRREGTSCLGQQEGFSKSCVWSIMDFNASSVFEQHKGKALRTMSW